MVLWQCLGVHPSCARNQTCSTKIDCQDYDSKAGMEGRKTIRPSFTTGLFSPRVPIVSLLHGLLKHPSVVLKLQGSGCFSLNMLGQLSQVVVSTSSRCTIAPARTTRWKSCITAYIDTNSKEKLSVRTSERVKRSTFMHGQKKYEILV